MKWEDRPKSKNVEDRRGQRTKPGITLGGGGLILIVILALVLGINPLQLLNQAGPGAGPQQPGPQAPAQVDPAEQRLADFTEVIFGDTERVWTDLFNRTGKQYRKPTLVLFSGGVRSACGFAGSAVGPFYCPADAKVYIDLSFYKDMERQLGAPGDFAQAYVVAHEVGHHVQRLLGYSSRVEDARQSGSKTEANRMSVRLELQADYLAGVWAHHGQKKYQFLEPGDLEEALNAAFQIGDDRLQKKSQGTVVPDAFTHGTSEQRMRWFKMGFQTGDVGQAKLLFDLPYNRL